MKRTTNLSNTQFRYQLVFFIHIYACIWLHIWLAEGCLWHLLPSQNLWWHLLPGGMFCLLQHVDVKFKLQLYYATQTVPKDRKSQ